MSTPLSGKRIVLGITGSIACYKSVALASRLAQLGARVDVIMTDSATRFIAPITFQSVTGRRCLTNKELWGSEAHVLHVGLARQADLVVVAPITANTLARLAHGQADDLLALTIVGMATGSDSAPLLLAPAMDGEMWQHPATQKNVATLVDRGAILIGPVAGHLASGLVAQGRMSEPEELVAHIRFRLSRSGPLAGRRVVVTAGGTREPIDPVRALTNYSSGKQGVALAEAALDLGADVVLISPSLALPIPFGLTHVRADTANEMLTAVLQHCQDAQVLLMAAAVSDFRPAAVADQKIKKEKGPPVIALERNPDILEAVHEWRNRTGSDLIVVGFAAETENLIEQAQSKLERKGMALIVGNDVSATDAGFAVDTNRVIILDRSGSQERLPLMTKREVADEILARVLGMVEPLGGGG